MLLKKSTTIAAALITICAVGFAGQPARAENIVITGDAAGSLGITSADKSLFDLTGLYPGDTARSSVTIVNNDTVNQGFELFMSVENTVTAEYDLGNITRLAVAVGGNTIYNGMLTYAGEHFKSAAPVSLGRIAGGSSVKLDFDIELDGELADNYYQELDAHFVVTFTASSYGPPDDLPDNPPYNPGSGFTSRMPSSTFASVPVEDIVVTAFEQPAPEVIIDDIEVPLADEDSVIIEEIKTPLTDNEKEMPKTGELSLALNIAVGLALIGCGVLILQIAKGGKGDV